MNIERQQQQQLQEERREEENQYFNYIYYLSEISAYKLNEKNRNEPILRRQVLVRNLLEVSSQQLLVPSYQNQVLEQEEEEAVVDDEENWLNACFEQLDQDEPMDEDNETNGQLVLAVPLNYNSSGKETVFLI